MDKNTILYYCIPYNLLKLVHQVQLCDEVLASNNVRAYSTSILESQARLLAISVLKFIAVEQIKQNAS